MNEFLKLKILLVNLKSSLESLADEDKETSQNTQQKDKDMENIRYLIPNKQKFQEKKKQRKWRKLNYVRIQVKRSERLPI